MQDQQQCAGQTIKVRQREYGFRSPANASKTLISKNYWSCIGVAGVHKNSGAAFLCHFDSPWTPWAIDNLVKDIQKHSLEPKDFELHVYGGFWWGACLALILVGFYLSIAKGISNVISLGLPLLGSFYVVTFLATRAKLAVFGFSKPKRIKYWSYPLKGGGRHFQICIGALVNRAPEIQSQSPKGEDNDFKDEGCWCQKARKSKDSD